MLQTSHYDKLKAAVNNSKTPKSSKAELQKYLKEYDKWKSSILHLKGNYDYILKNSVKLSNNYSSLDIIILQNNVCCLKT